MVRAGFVVTTIDIQAINNNRRELDFIKVSETYRAGNWVQLKFEVGYLKAQYFQHVTNENIVEYADVLFLEAIAASMLMDSSLVQIREQFQILGTIHLQNQALSDKLHAQWFLIDFWTRKEMILLMDVPYKKKVTELGILHSQFINDSSRHVQDLHVDLLNASFKVLLPKSNKKEGIAILTNAFYKFQEIGLVGQQKACVIRMAFAKLQDLESTMSIDSFVKQINVIEQEFSSYFLPFSDIKSEVDHSFVLYILERFKFCLSQDVFRVTSAEFHFKNKLQSISSWSTAVKQYEFLAELMSKKCGSIKLY